MTQETPFTAPFEEGAATTPTVLHDVVAALGAAAADVHIDTRGAIVEARVPADQLEAAVRALVTLEARLIDAFVTSEDPYLTLHLGFAFDRAGHYVAVFSTIPEGDEYPALSEIAPAAFIEECEIYEQYGVRPAGGKPLNRVLLAPNADARLLRRTDSQPASPPVAHAPHFVRGQAFEFPFGPVRVAGWESLYMGLVTTGEEVLDLYLFHWHKHRGVERRLIGLDTAQALFYVERIDGLSAVGNGLAFCRAVEAVAGPKPHFAAACARAVALELERIYNHTAALAMLCQTTGLSVGQAQLEAALERFLRLNLAAFGHRYLFNVLAIGGVRRAPDQAAVRSQLGPLCDELAGLGQALFRTNSHVDRLEATGEITAETARRLALVGPIARACGIGIDTRADHPFPPYDQTGVHVSTHASGDVLARARVFVDEIAESRRLIEDLIDSAEDAPSQTDHHERDTGLGWAESARGEALAWVDVDPQGRLSYVRLRPAPVRNWRAFDDAARSQNVFTDIPIIEASFWQTVAGFAR